MTTSCTSFSAKYAVQGICFETDHESLCSIHGSKYFDFKFYEKYHIRPTYNTPKYVSFFLFVAIKIAVFVLVILGTKHLKYYFKFMKMTDIDLFYMKENI